MDAEELLLRWTVRIAVLFYVLSLLKRISFSQSPNRLPIARLFWTFGYFFVLLHFICAFQFQHHWSNAEAYRATALQTEQDVGIRWGGGLYINYLFALVWGLDVCWWWLWPERYKNRSRIIEWSIQLFLAFIVFNATVIFATGFSRWFGIVSCTIFAIVLGWKVFGRRM